MQRQKISDTFFFRYSSRIVVSGFIGVILFIGTTLLGGALHPGYSHVTQLISELYAVNAPFANVLRFGGYIPSGLLIAAFSFLAMKGVPKTGRSKLGFLGIGIFYGLATVVVSIFSCDEGCNKQFINPSTSQVIHNSVGLFTYLIVPVCLIILGMEAKKWEGRTYLSLPGIAAGSLSLVLVILFFANPASSWAGVIQRCIEFCILGWIALCSFSFMKR